MQKLSEVSLENTVSVKVDCKINQQVIVNNFRIIIECLNNLKGTSQSHQNSINDHSQKLQKMQTQIQKLQSLNNNNVKFEQKENNIDKSGNNSGQQLHNQNGRLEQLQKKVQKNSNGILDNIKDINLVNKQIQEIKQMLKKMKETKNDNKLQQKQSQKAIANTNNFDLDSINNMKRQIQQNREDINKMKGQINKLQDDSSKLSEKVGQIQNKSNQFSSLPISNQNDGSNNNNDDQTLNQNYLHDFRDKLAILQKKLADLDNKTNQNTNNLQQVSSNLNTLDNFTNDQINKLKNLLDQLFNKGLSQDDLNKVIKDIDRLRKDMQNLKKDNLNSRTSIQDESNRKNDRANYTQTRFGKDDEKIRELQSRIQYLQKMIGSKKSIQDDSKQDKLPLIKRPQRRERDTSHHQKSTMKKDMNEIKNDLQNWLSNYLASNKTRDNLQDLELKIQQLKNLIGRKADQQGMRKGLTFLESKINQLYIFLTQPDGQDAMIVRKGLNCLSCSKKVQKLRGKIGPHINWNNMTQTSYSPPKVGYSKHMGEHTPQKEQDL